MNGSARSCASRARVCEIKKKQRLRDAVTHGLGGHRLGERHVGRTYRCMIPREGSSHCGQSHIERQMGSCFLPGHTVSRAMANRYRFFL